MINLIEIDERGFLGITGVNGTSIVFFLQIKTLGSTESLVERIKARFNSDCTPLYLEGDVMTRFCRFSWDKHLPVTPQNRNDFLIEARQKVKDIVGLLDAEEAFRAS